MKVLAVALAGLLFGLAAISDTAPDNKPPTVTPVSVVQSPPKPAEQTPATSPGQKMMTELEFERFQNNTLRWENAQLKQRVEELEKRLNDRGASKADSTYTQPEQAPQKSHVQSRYAAGWYRDQRGRLYYLDEYGNASYQRVNTGGKSRGGFFRGGLLKKACGLFGCR